MDHIMERLDMQSADGAQLTMDALYKILPAAFTEARDPNTGELCRKVDFDALRRLLGDCATDTDGAECYRFTWVGKNAARAEAARPVDKTLRPVPEDSVDWDRTKNVYIEGDNLEVLKLLQRSYLGKVKMIYIDPPYNTGNDFVYDDDFSRTAQEEDLAAGNIDELGNRYRQNTGANGRFHSDWCSMIYPRLLVARSLLTEDGVIFISIDDNEVENLRKICDEVFGESNFVAFFNLRRTGGRQNSKHYAVIHEYVLCCAKNIGMFDAGVEINSSSVYNKYDEDKKAWYKTQLLRKWGSNSLRTDRPNLYYPIKGPDGSNVYPIIFNDKSHNGEVTVKKIQGRWRLKKVHIDKMLREGLIEFHKQYDEWVPYERVYAPVDGTEETKKYTTWIDDISNGANSLKNLFSSIVFDYSKSVDLLVRFLKIADFSKGDICLDFFSGSATTAHAVMQLNAEDGGNRRYIMVQLPEETPERSVARKAGYNTIPEIGKERIRRAGRKIQEELAAKRAQAGLFAGEEERAELDTGFRVFRLAESNYEEVSKSPQEYEQDQLSLFENNIKADRTDLDLLFGAMLAWGVTLDQPIETDTVDGSTVYSVNGGELVACFAPGITDSVINAIAAKAPLRVLFRDSCFAEDSQKINIYEQLKQQLDWTDDSAVKNIKVI